MLFVKSFNIFPKSHFEYNLELFFFKLIILL